jgi:hypothetical protein
MAQSMTGGKRDKRKRLIVPDDFLATPALEKKLSEAKGAKELDCPRDFFIEPIED